MLVVEGFYGVPWSHAERLSMMSFLAENDFEGYCYAPKADKKLRQQFGELYEVSELEQLVVLSETCKAHNLSFLMGISPVDFVTDTDLLVLKTKLAQLTQISHLKLAVFFDDIRGDRQSLAQDQLAFLDHLKNAGLTISIFCPTYYSFDERLDEVFGQRPADYIEAIGKGVSSHVAIAWTGQKVITRHYDQASLEKARKLLGRKPLVWDNSFVNDGRLTSPFLPIGVVPNVQAVVDSVAGFMFNPMNQSALACINLYMIKHQVDLSEALEKIAPQCKSLVLNYLPEFRELGLDNLPQNKRQEMLELFHNLKHPVAFEITRWLKGEFIFDPACLT